MANALAYDIADAALCPVPDDGASAADEIRPRAVRVGLPLPFLRHLDDDGRDHLPIGPDAARRAYRMHLERRGGSGDAIDGHLPAARPEAEGAVQLLIFRMIRQEWLQLG